MSELTIREITKSEIPKVARFIAQVLAGGNSERYDLLYERYANQLPNRPSQLAWVYRAMFRKQQIASVIHTYDFVLRYGRASLKVVAISMLCTHSQYRHQGYASALLRYTLTYAAEQGAHLVLLNSTINDFFPRFGFSPVWASYTLSSPTALASELKQPHQLRIATPADLAIMAQLYNQYWGMRVTAERPMNWWRWRMEHGRSAVTRIPQY
ncbi:MAG: GNAT family N-acetyltransferase [Chloroflexota bacterium]